MAEAPLVTRLKVEGADECIRSLRDYYRCFKEGIVDVKALNMGLREWSGQIYGGRRALSLMRTEWKLQHAAWLEGARVMRDVGRIGKTLVGVWQAYTIGMIRVDRAQADVRKTTKDLAQAQDVYNRYLEVFGEDSVYTIQALEDVESAQRANEDALKDAKKAQDDMNAGMLTFALSLPTVGADLITMVGHLRALKEILVGAGGVKEALVAAKLAISGLGVAGAAALIGLPALAVGATLALNELIKATTPPEVLEAYREAREIVPYAPPRGGVISRTAMRILEREEPETYRRIREEASGAARGYTRVLGGGALGIPFVPETGFYRLHRGEEVRRSTVARGDRGVTVRQVRITQNIANVSSDYDVDRLATEAYRKLMRKMEAAR